MANNDFDGELFERRLHTLKDSQESIQGLSAWCLERRQHHKKIVATWLQVLKKVKVEHRLTLFYLANDVIQYSKRKNFEFVESWGTTLQRATTMVRDEKVKHRILRIFKIWDQRQVYDEEFLADLSGLISAAPKKKSEPQPIGQADEFQSALLVSTMRSCATLEQATDARLRDLRESNIDIDNAEELCSSLKDRRHVEDAEKEVDIAVRSIENYVRALEAEIRERTQVLDLLEQADQFYETQRGEVKIVTNAYRNFGSRVKNLKKKLDELLPTLVSPLPSPDVNAPSPSPDSDLDLPGEDSHIMNQTTLINVAPPSMYGSYTQDYEPLPVPAPDLGQSNMSGDFTQSFSSFMGGNVDFDMRNLFNDRSTTPTGGSQYNDSLEAKPIEVINMRPSKTGKSNDEFNVSNFLKTVLPISDASSNVTSIPGLGLDARDGSLESPQPDYTHSPVIGHPLTPTSGRLISTLNAPIVDLNNHQINHSTPLPVRNLSGESHSPSPYSSQNNQSNVTLPFDDTVNSVNPLPPPPLPPPIFLDDENCYSKLPPKFPTWTPTSEATKEPANWEEKGKNSMNPIWPGENEEKAKNRWTDGGGEHWDAGSDSAWSSSVRGKAETLSETPESPPIYEKSGFADPVEYDDSQPQEPILSSREDVDHRVTPMPMIAAGQLPHRLMKAADVDHRNLISLTGSPANHGNANDPSVVVLANNNSVWPTSNRDYRDRMQPGDIVESVDMEMSDEEAEGKQKGRVLVDVRSEDRDRRGLLPPPQHLDMEMRIVPLPTGQLQARGPMGIRAAHPNQPVFNQGQQPDFHPHPGNFRPGLLDFPTNRPNFQQNHSPAFLQKQQEFRQGQPEFHQAQQEFHPGQQEFHPNQHQDFGFHENQHGRRTNQEFHGEPQARGRYQPPTEHQQRDSPMFHRHERGGRGRGFRNRRDRFPEDHNSPHQRNNSHNRRLRVPDRQRSPEFVPNNRPPLLLKPPESVVVFDENGTPIGMPENDQQQPSNAPDQAQLIPRDSQRFNSEDGPISPLVPDQRIRQPESDLGIGNQQVSPEFTTDSPSIPDQQVPPAAVPESQQRQLGASNQQVPVAPMIPECEVADAPHDAREVQHVPLVEARQPVGVDERQLAEDHPAVDHQGPNEESAPREVDVPPKQLSEQLEALMNSSKLAGNDLKRQQPANGGSGEEQDDGAPVNKRAPLPNGPPIVGALPPCGPTGLLGPNGPGPHGGAAEIHPVLVYEYENPNSAPNFRPPRGGGGQAGGPFPPWRGGPPRGNRGGFRGGPRGGSWIDRGSRGGFPSRGSKRGGQFRGAGFRGRGRGNNW